MKTMDELIASLPERFRGIDLGHFEPCTDLDEANYALGYVVGRYAELLRAYSIAIEKAEQ